MSTINPNLGNVTSTKVTEVKTTEVRSAGAAAPGAPAPPAPPSRPMPSGTAVSDTGDVNEEEEIPQLDLVGEVNWDDVEAVKDFIKTFDFNKDGAVDESDVVIMQNYIKHKQQPRDVKMNVRTHGDLTGDKKINAKDVKKLREQIAKFDVNDTGKVTGEDAKTIENFINKFNEIGEIKWKTGTWPLRTEHSKPDGINKADAAIINRAIDGSQDVDGDGKITEKDEILAERVYLLMDLDNDGEVTQNDLNIFNNLFNKLNVR
ncbi:MAG: dockerin type I domain-containing protein [Candidatus Eremiobacterota bacterium]